MRYELKSFLRVVYYEHKENNNNNNNIVYKQRITN